MGIFRGVCFQTFFSGGFFDGQNWPWANSDGEGEGAAGKCFLNFQMSRYPKHGHRPIKNQLFYISSKT